MQKFEAVRVIEALRSGISSRHLSAIFSYGREGLLEKIQRDLDAVAGDESLRAMVLKGDYGEGKTHLLNVVFNRAQEQNFAVSFVVLSKETPFGRLDRVYPKVVAGTYLPGEVEPGIEALLRDVRPGSAIADEILTFARHELHSKVFRVLENYFEAGDTQDLHDLAGDLAGQWLPVDQLKAVHKRNFGRSAKIERFRPKLDVWNYFRLLAYLIKRRGCAGWVILFDEFELVGTLGIAARADAYSNLGRFLFPEEADSLVSTYVVFSVASRFWPDVLLRSRRPDIDEVPRRLVAKGEPHRADLVRRVLNTLLQDAVALETLPAGEVRRMLAAVQDFHANAYGWEPKADLDAILEATRHARLRTKIRYALEYLDLKYLYGEEPLLLAETPGEPALDEAAATGDAAANVKTL
ncbi:MAG: hypothetical protein XD69_0966 [Clostridia bacterium 62_21]|nr:MAG: hypothetical protein XD69_0966 [Clostridia bacterium 62_21]